MSIDLASELATPAKKIKMHDRDLANQLTRAATSIALNLSEGSGREMGDRMQLFRTALGSAKETKTALDLARAWGWLSTEDTRKPLALLDQILAICWRLTHPRT
jgi:four helix bundle protein